MTQIIQTIYLLSMTVVVAAMWPQIKQLLITKRSDELNLGTWVTWFICQVIAVAYAVSIGATAYIIMSLVWIAFYAVIISLIIKYREPIKKYKQRRTARRLEKAKPALIPLKVRASE